MLEIITLVQGPVQTNTYLVADSVSSQAAVIDPAWNGLKIVSEAQSHRWTITQIWLTHAHFDHIAGAAEVAHRVKPSPEVLLHSADLALYQNQGGAAMFGFTIQNPPEVSANLAHGQDLLLGEITFEVRHTPGHTPGHVVFYCPSAMALFCGDVIFQNGIGRTDLPGASYPTLISSIQQQIMTLPDSTRLYSGHGPSTSIGLERTYNPFLTN